MNDNNTLLISGSGPDVSGWLFSVDTRAVPAAIEKVDFLNTSGLAVVAGRLYRALSSASERNAVGELLVYDADGVVAYHRMAGLADPHGLIWDGTHLVVPCSFTNEIRWLTPAGSTSRIWRAPGEGDAWHINGVHLRNGRLFASAFGVFPTHRGWRDVLGKPTGIIFDVETQEAVVTGLTCPHDPLFIDGGWLVCDSFTRRLLLVNEATGGLIHAADLDGWSRGVAVSSEHIFVGVSGARHGATEPQRARVVIMNRSDWSVIGEIALPCDEVGTLALVDQEMLRGLRRGFRTNDLRVAVQDRADLFRAAGNAGRPLSLTPMHALAEPKDFRVRISAKAPMQVKSGSFFEVHLKIKNRGKKTLLTAAPFPINVAIIFEPVGSSSNDADVRREPLPEPLAPGATIGFTLSVQSPLVPGTYRVRYTLVQEWNRWFDNDQRRLARVLSANRRYLRLRVH